MIKPIREIADKQVNFLRVHITKRGFAYIPKILGDATIEVSERGDWLCLTYTPSTKPRQVESAYIGTSYITDYIGMWPSTTLKFSIEEQLDGTWHGCVDRKGRPE